MNSACSGLVNFGKNVVTDLKTAEPIRIEKITFIGFNYTPNGKTKSASEYFYGIFHGRDNINIY